MKKTTRQGSAFHELIDLAEKALDRSYAPYSHFQVGAALEDVTGKVWLGGNIESVSYTPTSCAERTALFKAVSEGSRSFRAIAIVGRKQGMRELTEQFTSPCGVCRQALVEFCDESMPVILANGAGEVQEWTLGELLPLSIQQSNLLDEAKKK